MKKCYTIILLLIGFNCLDEIKLIDDSKEESSPTLTFSYSIYKNITDMTSYCLQYESMCLNKIKDGLTLIESILNISYNEQYFFRKYKINYYEKQSTNKKNLY